MPDSMAMGPYGDVVRFAANYSVSRQLNREHAWAMAQEVQINAGLRDQLADRAKQVEHMTAERDSCYQRNGGLAQGLIDLSAKNERMKSWATIGKVSVGAFSLAVITTCTLLVLNALHP